MEGSRRRGDAAAVLPPRTRARQHRASLQLGATDAPRDSSAAGRGRSFKARQLMVREDNVWPNGSTRAEAAKIEPQRVLTRALEITHVAIVVILNWD